MRISDWSSDVCSSDLEQPFIDERQIARLQDFELVRFDLPIVFGMEDMVNGGQADILVAAAVAGDEMPVEQFIVIFGVGPGQRVELDRIARRIDAFDNNIVDHEEDRQSTRLNSSH